MKKKSFLLVFVSLVLSLSFMSFKMQGTVNTEDNIILNVIIGASVVLIFLFVFFALQNMKSIPDSLFSSNTEDDQNAKSPDQESAN